MVYVLGVEQNSMMGLKFPLDTICPKCKNAVYHQEYKEEIMLVCPFCKCDNDADCIKVVPSASTKTN